MFLDVFGSSKIIIRTGTIITRTYENIESVNSRVYIAMKRTIEPTGERNELSPVAAVESPWRNADILGRFVASIYNVDEQMRN